MKTPAKMTLVLVGFLAPVAIAFFVMQPSAGLKGFYQSELLGSEVVQLSVYSDEKRFFQYISNREVNSGKFVETADRTYHFDGDELDFDLILAADNSFTLSLAKLSDAPILMRNISSVPAGFGGDWADVEAYKDFLH